MPQGRARRSERGTAGTATPPPRAVAHEPTMAEVAETLARHADWEASVHSSVIEALIREHGWVGRVADVLAVVAEEEERMAYIAGGRRAGTIVTWLSQWVDSPLSIGEIRLVLASGGWDPDPFVVLARAGVLGDFLRLADGSPRRVRGVLAGGWLSDQFALADDPEIVSAVRAVIEGSTQA